MSGIERRCPDCGKSITVPRQDDLSWRTVERWVAEHPAHCPAATGTSALKAEDEARSIRAMGDATAFIQWKGTDVCLDLHCECGSSHFDGDFLYAIECVRCGRKYDMPTTLTLEPFSGEHEAKPSFES